MARLQLDLSETNDDLISEIQKKLGPMTKKDVVENALMILAWAVKEAWDGKEIAAVDERNQAYRLLQTPAIMAATMKGTKERDRNGDAAA